MDSGRIALSSGGADRWFEPRHVRMRIYAGLLGSALLFTAVRCALVTSRDGHTPLLSANDRSRWATVASLLDADSLDASAFEIDGVIVRPGWNTIDKVSHIGADGNQHYYSSKPPLHALMLWPVVSFVEWATGSRLVERPFLVGRISIALVNLTLLAIFGWSAILTSERWGESSRGKLFVVACACWGTQLTTFAVTINNHLPAAAAAFVALYASMRIWYDGERHWRWFVVAGFASALTSAFELPALAFVAAIVGMLMFVSPKRGVCGALPPLIVVASCYFAANWLAHDSWRPPYAHRVAGEDWTGDNWYVYPGSYWLPGNPQGVDAGEPNRGTYAFHVLLGHHGLLSLTPIWWFSLYGVWRSMMDRKWLALTGLTVALTIVCLVFFVWMRPVGDRNYGGVCCGFRWMFWLIPLWLAIMLPAADRILRDRRGRWVAAALFAASFFSTVYPSMNPWTHPWIYAWLN